MRQYQYVLALAICSLFVTGCTPKGIQEDYQDALQEQNKAIDDAIQSNQQFVKEADKVMPTDIEDTLMPHLASDSDAKSDEHFNLKVVDMPVAHFFASLAKDSDYNFIVDPSIQGNISLNLQNTTMMKVLDAVKELYGLQYELRPYGYQITKLDLISKIFSVDHLNIQRTGSSEMTVDDPSSVSSASSGGSSSSSSSSSSTGTSSDIKTSFTSPDFWKDLQSTLAQMINAKVSSDPNSNTSGDSGGSSASSSSSPAVSIDTTSGLVFVRADPEDMERVSEYLDQLKQIDQREVLIEAKVIEVSLSKSFSTGINWSDSHFSYDNTSSTFSFFKTIQSEQSDPFGAVIKFLSTQGNVSVLSSPRISTLNNQQAVIKVGNDQYYVTGYNTSTSSNTSTSTLFASPVLQSFFSGVSLDVTPVINKDKQISLHIHPTISYVTGKDLAIVVPASQGNGFTLPTASSQIRESDSIVQAESGQVIIIGGLMSTDVEINKQTIPGLENLRASPNNDTTSDIDELVILLRPVVTDHKTWVDELQKEKNSKWFHKEIVDSIKKNKQEAEQYR